MRLIYDSAERGAGGTVAQVSYSDTSGFGAVGASESRGIPVFAPRGVAYRPCEGDNLLLLPVDGVDMCAGVLADTRELLDGELRIASAGGASIHLAKDGVVNISARELYINGKKIVWEGD